MARQLLRRCPPNTRLTLSDFEAEVRFSARRKTLSIKVDNGQVVAQAPHFIKLDEIEQFLRSKQHWVREKLAQQRWQLADRQRHWRSGERLPFLGADLQLQIEPGNRGTVAREGETLHVRVRSGDPDKWPERVRRLVQQWYRRQAEAELRERLARWQGITGIRASSCAVRTYKSRWGGCSHRGEISFNWKLMMAPPAVVDYVVIHELCHIRHFNHSPAYWRLVESFDPHYKQHKTWLRRNGLRLELS